MLLLKTQDDAASRLVELHEGSRGSHYKGVAEGRIALYYGRRVESH